MKNEIKYPFTDEVCDLFDCQVMTDYDRADEEIETYYVGHPGDWDVGLHSAVITPAFVTREQLEEHCKAEIETYRTRSEAATFPYS